MDRSAREGKALTDARIQSDLACSNKAAYNGLGTKMLPSIVGYRRYRLYPGAMSIYSKRSVRGLDFYQTEALRGDEVL